MPTIATTRFRRIAVALAAGVVVAGSAGAASAPAAVSVPEVDVPTRTVTEGQTARYRLTVKCKFQRCKYRVFTKSGSAKAGRNKDFKHAFAAKSLRRGQTARLILNIKTNDDSARERSESLTVKVQGTFGGLKRVDTGKVVIRASDSPLADQLTGEMPGEVPGEVLEPAPAFDAGMAEDAPAPADGGAPAPAEAPAAPAAPPADPAMAPNGDSSGATASTTTLGTATTIRCTTAYQVGIQGQFGAWGHYIPGCTARLTCPTSKSVCQARTESRINGEQYIGHKVTLNSRMRVFSASGNNYWFRDVSCGMDNWCATEDLVNIRGGESASVQCNGVRQSAPEANRAKVSCTLTLE